MAPTYPAPAPPYLGPPAKHSGTGNKRPGPDPFDRIVLHGTTGAGSATKGYARKIAAYFRSPQAGGSAHYVIDPGEVIQTAYDDVVAWHAPPNRHSLGVEFCDPVSMDPTRWDRPGHAAELQLGARLVAELCLAYNHPPVWVGVKGLRAGKRGVTDHDNVSDAFGQSTHWDLGAFPRRRFMGLVRAEIARIEGDLERAAAEQTRAASRITKARDLLEAALRYPKASAKRRARIRQALDTLPNQ